MITLQYLQENALWIGPLILFIVHWINYGIGKFFSYLARKLIKKFNTKKSPQDKSYTQDSVKSEVRPGVATISQVPVDKIVKKKKLKKKKLKLNKQGYLDLTKRRVI